MGRGCHQVLGQKATFVLMLRPRSTSAASTIAAICRAAVRPAATRSVNDRSRASASTALPSSMIAPATDSSCSIRSVSSSMTCTRPAPVQKSRPSFLPGRVLVEQASGRHSERCRELFDDRYSWIAAAALNVADIGAMDVGAIGIVFLTPAFGVARSAYVSGKASAYFHLR